MANDKEKSKAGWLIALAALLAGGVWLWNRQPVQASNDKIVIQAVTWI